MSENQNNDSLPFQAEIQQLLNLIIHSLYSDREIFLRELISNASDACGRLRFESLTNPEMLEGEFIPSIDIEINKTSKTIKVIDNGIGMTSEDVIQNIGTIARSGTKQFVNALSEDDSIDSQLIGQFGVGFYAAFMVAEHVTIRTRAAGHAPENGVHWESDGVSGYTISDTTIEQHGTEITLQIREDSENFLDVDTVKGIVKKYSDHVSIPIRLKDASSEKSEVWDTVNSASALWTRSKNDISEEEYNNFYKSLAYDTTEPLLRLHNRVEGNLEYSALLFIPSKAPFDLWDVQRQKGIKLYVRRIFIADDTERLMPGYLRFVKGVIDSDDLPLNVSREFLQKTKQIDRIRTGTVRKLLAELKKVSKRDTEKYQNFWDEFGRAFKEGVTEDPENREKIADLLRFASTKGEDSNQSVSLKQYVDRMHENQESIYFITAESHTSAKDSPHLEIFKKHDVEVLLLSDPIDEWVVMGLHTYQEKQLKSIAKGDLKLDWLDQDKPEEQSDLKVDSLITKLKDSLSDRATDVRATNRLTDSPACLVVNEYGLSRNMSRILKASGQDSSSEMSPILEINPDHPLIQHLVTNDSNLDDWAHVLFDQATLSEGATLDQPADYVRRINSLLTDSIGEQSSVIITP